VTATLSVDAFHASVSDVWAVLVILRLAGVVGALASGGHASLLCVNVESARFDTFPAASNASTANVDDVPHGTLNVNVRPVVDPAKFPLR